MSLEQEDKLKKYVNMAMIIWGAFCASIIIYGVIVFMYVNLHKKEAPLYNGDINILLAVFAGIGIMNAGISFFIKNFLANPEKIASRLKSSPSSSGMVTSIQLSFLTTMAFRESIALFGVFLSLMTNNTLYYIYFGIPSFFLILMTFPSLNSWKAIAEEVIAIYPEAKIGMDTSANDI